MSNYNAPDKVTGDTWSPTEHNQMKAAINSKYDGDIFEIVADLSSPTTKKVIHTNGLKSLFDRAILDGQTALTGNENIMNLGKGVYKCSVTPTHSSYPVKKKCEVIVFSANVRFFISTETDQFYFSNSPTNWTELASKNWVQLIYGTPIPDGTPTLTVGSTDIGVELMDGSTDTSGMILVTNKTSSVLSSTGTNIHVSFEHIQNPHSIVLSPAAMQDSFVQLYGLDATGIYIRITIDLPANFTGAFYYMIK